MQNLKVIVGSTREGRNADPVLRWLMPALEERKEFRTEVLDLRAWPLPFFQETIASVGDFSNPTYSEPIVKRWNEEIRAADAFILVTPEYNRSLPAVLKNAIDSVFFSFGFRHKPVAFVGYSLGPTAGARAVEHLTQVMVETEAIPVRTPTLVPMVASAFGPSGKPSNPTLELTLTVMLDDLQWLSTALTDARQETPTVPAAIRIRAAAGRK